jgi:hypothetical protein
MVKIIQDHPWAHEEVWDCWQKDESCLVKPRDFPDPTQYLLRHKGPQGLFQYVDDLEGGFKLRCMEWKLLHERFEKATTPVKNYMAVTWGLMDNKMGYGLTFSRLYPLWLGKKVIPFIGIRGIGQMIDEHEVTCIICDANFLAEYLAQDPPQGTSLLAIVNICRVLPAAKADMLEAKFKVPVFSALGVGQTGIISWSRAKDVLRNSWGNFVVPVEEKGNTIRVKPPVPWGETDKGWIELPA